MSLRRINGLEGRTLKIYAPSGDLDRSACSYYRQATPLRTLAQLGLAHFVVDNGRMPEHDRQQNLAYSDLHLYYLQVSRGVLDRINQFRQWKPARDHTATLRKPPQVIFDADDHIEYCDVFNPKFVTLGTTLPDGTRLQPGARIHADLDDGTNVLLWEDGAEYDDGTFDLQRNLKRLRQYKMIIRQADGVSTSTENLARVFRRYGAKNVYVFPNSLRRCDYPYIPIERPANKVRILWQGGYSHFGDWHPIREAMGQVLQDRPHAELVVWGMLFPSLQKACPPKQLKFIDWLPYQKYTFRLATIGHHINLCPLARGEFNDTKSPIKYLESSAITRPATTLAAAGPVYGPAIEDGETGLLFDFSNPQDFYEKLIALIDDASLRQRLASRAHEQVWDVWPAEKHVRNLYRWYADMRETR